MKTKTTLLAIGCLAFSVLASCGQGTVNFNNTPVTFPDSATVDRFVYGPDGNRLTGLNWAAALYFGTQADSINSLATLNATDTSLTSALGRFRIPTTVLPGTWVGGSRTLLGTSPGQMLYMQVRVWDVSLYESFDVAKASGGITGQSAAFAYTISTSLPPSPSDLVMYNFRGIIPEPSVLCLSLIGLGSLLLVRRGR